MKPANEFRGSHRRAAAVCVIGFVTVGWTVLVFGMALDSIEVLFVFFFGMMAFAPSAGAAVGLVLTRDHTVSCRLVSICGALICVANLCALTLVWWNVFAPFNSFPAGALIGYGWCFQAVLAAVAAFVGFAAWEERYTQGEDAED